MIPVGPHAEAEEPAAVRLRVRLEHERAGPIAEQDGAVTVRGAPGATLLRGGAVGLAEEDRPVRVRPRKERGMALGAHEQNPAGRAGADERVADVQAREETGALHAEVEGVRRLEPEPLREEAPAAREVVVRGHRREDDQVDVLRAQPGVVEGPAGGLLREDGRGLPAPGEAPLGDPGPLADPLVARVHELREAVVRDDAFRNVHPGPADDGPRRGSASACRGGHRAILPDPAAAPRGLEAATGASPRAAATGGTLYFSADSSRSPVNPSTRVAQAKTFIPAGTSTRMRPAF